MVSNLTFEAERHFNPINPKPHMDIDELRMFFRDLPIGLDCEVAGVWNTLHSRIGTKHQLPTSTIRMILLSRQDISHLGLRMHACCV